MTPKTNGRRAAGNALIIAGVVLLLGMGGYFGWTSYRGAQLRAQLRQTPTPAPTATAAPTVAPTTALPSATPGVATPTTTAPAATAPMTAPATAAPSPTATAPRPTAAPTAAAPASVSPPTSFGPPVRIAFPDLKLDATVIEMSWKVVQTAAGLQSEWDLDALKNATGHHINSAPLGVPGNVVISGHNNIYGREFEAISLAWDDDTKQKVDDFTDKSDILNGRTVQLFSADGRRFDYKVVEFYRLKDLGVPLEQRIANGRFMQETDDTRLTLVTCWPITSNTHRLVVIAKPVNP